MNRKQRRAQPKDMQVEHLTEAELNKKVNDLVKARLDEIIMETLEASIAATLYVLNTEWQFGKKRAQHFMGEYNRVFDEALQGSSHKKIDEIKGKAMTMGVNLNRGGRK